MNPRIANYNLGHETAELIYVARGSREQGDALNPFAAGTDAAQEWRWGWLALWDTQEFGEPAWAAAHFPRGTGTGTDRAGNHTYSATWFEGNW